MCVSSALHTFASRFPFSFSLHQLWHEFHAKKSSHFLSVTWPLQIYFHCFQKKKKYSIKHTWNGNMESEWERKGHMKSRLTFIYFFVSFYSPALFAVITTGSGDREQPVIHYWKWINLHLTPHTSTTPSHIHTHTHSIEYFVYFNRLILASLRHLVIAMSLECDVNVGGFGYILYLATFRNHIYLIYLNGKINVMDLIWVSLKRGTFLALTYNLYCVVRYSASSVDCRRQFLEGQI